MTIQLYLSELRFSFEESSYTISEEFNGSHPLYVVIENFNTSVGIPESPVSITLSFIIGANTNATQGTYVYSTSDSVMCICVFVTILMIYMLTTLQLILFGPFKCIPISGVPCFALICIGCDNCVFILR